MSMATCIVQFNSMQTCRHLAKVMEKGRGKRELWGEGCRRDGGKRSGEGGTVGKVIRWGGLWKKIWWRGLWENRSSEVDCGKTDQVRGTVERDPVRGTVGRDPVSGTVGKVIWWGWLWEKRSGDGDCGKRSSEGDCGKRSGDGDCGKRDPVRRTVGKVIWWGWLWENRPGEGDCGKIDLVKGTVGKVIQWGGCGGQWVTKKLKTNKCSFDTFVLWSCFRLLAVSFVSDCFEAEE